jgi:hypothetical protein
MALLVEESSCGIGGECGDTMKTPPDRALQRFEVAGSHGEGFTGGKGLANSQTELAGTREPTAPRPSPSGCNRGVPWAGSKSLGW